MTFEILDHPDVVARRGAAIIAEAARQAVLERGRFVVALSGGRTPWIMLRALAAETVPWEAVEVAQVDERVAPEGDPERNLTHLRACLTAAPRLSPARVHAMPVEERDLDAAALRYAATLRTIVGTPAILDLVHLGLGADGHTASLVPDDPALEITDTDVTVTRPYQGTVRMTLTFPILARARRILWVVTGAEKAPMLARLRDGDPSIPAGRVARERALVLADRAAAEGTSPGTAG